MRRILCACLVALMLIVPGAARAAVELDFSGLTLEELYEARAMLDAEIERQSQPDGDSRVYESGSYVVGRDMPAGDYVLIENQEAVLAGVVVRAGDAADAELITYGLINRQAVIRLEQGVCLTLTDARAYPIGSAPAAGLVNNVVYEGGYLVGAHIPPGRYVVSTLEKAPLSSYSVYDDILGAQARLLKFEVLHDDALLELNDGDYVELSGCAMARAE